MVYSVIEYYIALKKGPTSATHTSWMNQSKTVTVKLDKDARHKRIHTIGFIFRKYKKNRRNQSTKTEVWLVVPFGEYNLGRGMKVLSGYWKCYRVTCVAIIYCILIYLKYVHLTCMYSASIKIFNKQLNKIIPLCSMMAQIMSYLHICTFNDCSVFVEFN